MTLCVHTVFFHQNNKKVGKFTAIASEFQGFSNHLTSFPNLWKSMAMMNALSDYDNNKAKWFAKQLASLVYQYQAKVLHRISLKKV